MMESVMELPMTKKVESTKIDADVLRDARIVTAVTGEGLSEYLSNLLRPLVTRDKERAIEKEQGGVKGKAKKGERTPEH